MNPKLYFLCGNAFMIYLNFECKILLHFKMLEFTVYVLNVYSRHADRPSQILVAVNERNKERSLKVSRTKLIMSGKCIFVDKIQFPSKLDKLDYISHAGINKFKILSINTEPASTADILSSAEGTIRSSSNTMT
jgi:hypothetical protein